MQRVYQFIIFDLQLSDMGFPESHCREALASTSNNWDRAMEYILSHPPAEFETDVSQTSIHV